MRREGRSKGDEENLLGVFLGGQTAGWVLEVSPSLTQLSVRRTGGRGWRNERREGERGKLKEAQLRKTKQGVCWRSRK